MCRRTRAPLGKLGRTAKSGRYIRDRCRPAARENALASRRIGQDHAAGSGRFPRSIQSRFPRASSARGFKRRFHPQGRRKAAGALRGGLYDRPVAVGADWTPAPGPGDLFRACKVRLLVDGRQSVDRLTFALQLTFALAGLRVSGAAVGTAHDAQPDPRHPARPDPELVGGGP